MKLLAYIKLTFKAMAKNLGSNMLAFAIFPILLGGLLAYFQSDVFTPSTKIPPVDVKLIDRDSSVSSKQFINFMKSKEINSIINVSEKAAKFEVIIPRGYEESLLNSKKISIIIGVKDDNTKGSPYTISALIDKYNEEVSEGLIIEKNLRKMKLTEAKKKELNEKISREIAKSYGANSIKETLIKTKKNLSSFEYYSVSLLGFQLIMLIMSLAAGVFLERELGLFRRIMSTAITKQQYFNYNLITCLIFAFIINLVYILAYRLLGLSFMGSIPTLLLIVLCQSILATAMVGILVAFFNKKTSIVFMNALLIIQMVIGGAFLPIGKMGTNFILDKLSNYSPDVLITKAFKSFLIYNSLEEIKLYLIAMLVISMGMYVISLAKVSLKWGE